MLHHGDDCPNKLNVENYLKELLSIKFSENDVIKYKQWVSTDRSQLEDKEEFADDFITLLSDILYKLTEHQALSSPTSEKLTTSVMDYVPNTKITKTLQI